MQSTNVPTKFPIPFADSGGKNTIPAASQTGTDAGKASLADGFPPATRTPLAAGGKPPYGLDMNGILNMMSAWNRWQAAGGPVRYDSAFASAIGGYPLGATLSGAAPGTIWCSTVENNTTNPDSGGANWIRVTAAALQVMTSSGTMAVPAGKTQALVFLWAAGGGGGGTFGAGSAASGGGGGEFRLGIIAGLTGGQSLNITIGLGGAGGASGSSPGNGGSGGISSFAGVMGCVGGGGGFSATNGLQTTSAGTAGGGGSGGALGINGTTGGLAQTAGTTPAGGSGGCTFMTSIPQPNIGVSAGTPGNFPGGGGNGGALGGGGGAGGNGLCIALFI